MKEHRLSVTDNRALRKILGPKWDEVIEEWKTFMIGTLTYYYSFIHSFHSISMCRMWWFLVILRSFFHSSLFYIPFPSTLFHQLVFQPPSLHLAIYFLVYLSALLLPNSYTTLFWEFYFLSFPVHAQTNIIYLTLLSLLQWAFIHCMNFFIC